MAELLDLLAVCCIAKRYTKRAHGAAYNRYDDGLEQMQRVRDMARKARERRGGPSVFGLGERQTRITCIETIARATEKFVAVIAEDNKSFYYADEDGFMEGQISNKDQINVNYRHSSSSDTVVAGGT